jgi:HAD superfamily hydrolase (TIGR01490 family)
MASAAFFDLDGTLLTVNSANLWVKRELRLGRIRYWQFLRAAMWLGFYRLGFLDMDRALTAALSQLAGKDEESIRQETQQWWREEVRPHIAPGARAVLQAHKAKGDLLVLLTSSSRYASEMAREEFGLDHVLFQGYEVRDGRFTGSPLRPLCYGPGKVEIAEAWAKENDIDLAKSSFYSDSSTDIPMLERVGSAYAVLPDPRLRRVAQKRGWPMLDWRTTAAS